MIDFLIRLLPYIAFALRFTDDPNRNYWKVHLVIGSLLVWIADMILAHLFFSPRKGEWTISHTLERTAPVSSESMRLAKAINAISPGHIKAAI